MRVLPAMQPCAACRPKPAPSRVTATPLTLPPLPSTHWIKSPAAEAGAGSAAPLACAAAAVCTPV